MGGDQEILTTCKLPLFFCFIKGVKLLGPKLFSLCINTCINVLFDNEEKHKTISLWSNIVLLCFEHMYVVSRGKKDEITF